MGYLWLFVAIILEVIATTALKASAGFTRFWPSLVVVLGYGGAFYFLSVVMQTIPVGVSYAIWSAVGIVLVSAIAVVLYGQQLDWPAVVGIGFIIAGVMMLSLCSNMQV